MYCKVEYDEDTNEYHLIQKKNTIESLEEPFGSEVISYVFGVFESKGKTKKKKEKEIKPKTRKLRIEEGSSSKEKEQEQAVIPSKLPIIGEDGSITWQDENYKKAWSRLSPKHKELLARNPEWLQESMDLYAKSIQENKIQKFVYPNVIFPPNRLPDGTYDFGNEFYNEVIKNYKDLIIDYQKDLERIGKPGNNVTKELADTWFKGKLEEKVYSYFYPVRSQLIIR
jgi:hypothetical protein